MVILHQLEVVTVDLVAVVMVVLHLKDQEMVEVVMDLETVAAVEEAVQEAVGLKVVLDKVDLVSLLFAIQPLKLRLHSQENIYDLFQNLVRF